jgi:uncharacterized membrane protein YkvA (DUF1232 family)
MAGQNTRGADEASVRAGFWRTFAKAAKQVPFAEDVVAAYYCALDPETPGKAKAVLLGALAYFIMPMDAVPDFLALVGFSDDIAVLTLAIATVRSNLTEPTGWQHENRLKSSHQARTDRPQSVPAPRLPLGTGIAHQSHQCSVISPSSPSSVRRRRAKASRMRDFTVPSGRPVSSAI